MDVTEESRHKDPEAEYTFRSGNLFIVDGTEDMHEDRGEDVGTYFFQALAMYERILRQKLIRNRDDWMGLVLFATTASDPETKNILTLLEFGPVTVEMLKKFLHIRDHRLPYYAGIASEKAYPLPQVLLHAARSFDSIKIKMPTRQLNLITCHDNPLLEDHEARHRVRVLAKDLKDIHVSLKVIGFGDWSFDLFYKELEMLASDSEVEPKRSFPIDIEREVMRKHVELGQIELRIGEKVLMKVKLQTFTKTRPALKKIAMDKRTNEPLESYFHYKKIDDLFDYGETNENDDDGYEDISNSSIRKWQHVGGRDIFLTLQESKNLTKLKPKGIEILRFEKALKKPPWYHIPPALFLGLSQGAPPGDAKLFAALLVQCQEKGVMAICAATIRANGRTYLFRMWPCPEDHGFYFFRIPFREEINRTMEDLFEKYTFDKPVFDDEEKLKIMEKVVKKFRIVYSPAIFPNPRVSKQQQYILALALNEVWDEETNFEDFTKPAVDLLQRNLSKRGLIDSFFEIFPNTKEDDTGRVDKVLRYDRETAERMVYGDLNKYRVPQLRAILKALNMGITGVKSVLVQRCEEYAKSM
ncbi:X-ray repair cross-complementing protein 6 [Diachasma alloeum]|uniref:X-ray repair cross-complementing protein 6 n=1 Tax=Diachasma alloeum TaxID=454923 RepID=UPI00073826E3|nr:X-ray repair cross-complementing protein 6 [Diachasma alloeum]